MACMSCVKSHRHDAEKTTLLLTTDLATDMSTKRLMVPASMLGHEFYDLQYAVTSEVAGKERGLALLAISIVLFGLIPAQKINAAELWPNEVDDLKARTSTDASKDP